MSDYGIVSTPAGGTGSGDVTPSSGGGSPEHRASLATPLLPVSEGTEAWSHGGAGSVMGRPDWGAPRPEEAGSRWGSDATALGVDSAHGGTAARRSQWAHQDSSESLTLGTDAFGDGPEQGLDLAGLTDDLEEPAGGFAGRRAGERGATLRIRAGDDDNASAPRSVTGPASARFPGDAGRVPPAQSPRSDAPDGSGRHRGSDAESRRRSFAAAASMRRSGAAASPGGSARRSASRGHAQASFPGAGAAAGAPLVLGSAKSPRRVASTDLGSRRGSIPGGGGTPGRFRPPRPGEDGWGRESRAQTLGGGSTADWPAEEAAAAGPGADAVVIARGPSDAAGADGGAAEADSVRRGRSHSGSSGGRRHGDRGKLGAGRWR